MDIDLNRALEELVGDDPSPASDATTDRAATAGTAAGGTTATASADTQQPTTEPVGAPEPTATTDPAEDDAPDAIDGASAAPIGQGVAGSTGRRRLAIAAGTATLAVIGTIALWPHGDDGTMAGPVAATPSPSTPGASTPATAAPGNGTAASPSPRVLPMPAVATWAWTGTDPAATTIDEDQARERCGARPSEQVVSARGGHTFRPGTAVRLGPRRAAVPANGAVPTGWRTCFLGYQAQPVAAAIGENELTKDTARLAAACSRHSGFSLSGWRAVVSDARFNPRTNTVTDASVAFNGPGGWAMGCELSAGSDVALLSFLPPVTASSPATCPRVSAAPMGRPGGGGGMGDGHGHPGGVPGGGPAGAPGDDPDDAPGEGPGGALYWVTAFGRVPNTGGTAARVASGGYDVGKVSKAAAMVHTGGGLAVANHTWKPSQQAPDEPGAQPVLSFFDKAGTRLSSCTPA